MSHLPTCSCNWGVTTPHSLRELLLAEWLKHGTALALNRNHVLGHFKQNFPKPKCGGCYPAIVMGLEVLLDQFTQPPIKSEDAARIAGLSAQVLANHGTTTAENLSTAALKALAGEKFTELKLDEPFVALARALASGYAGFGHTPLETSFA